MIPAEGVSGNVTGDASDSASEGVVRDALRLLAYEQWLWSDERPSPEQVDAYVDRILALVRPVEGVVLTPEEVGVALDVLRAHLGMQGGRLSDLFPDKVRELAARLEAAL